MSTEISIRSIENGYLVGTYAEPVGGEFQGKYEQWYCISPEEVQDRVGKLLLG